MPKKCQASVTLPKAVYELARKQADSEEKSIAKHITDLIKEQEATPSG